VGRVAHIPSSVSVDSHINYALVFILGKGV
jgi:hypothetical protein